MLSNRCCCETTDERDIKFDEILAKHKDTKGALIPILHDVQDLYGYLPEEALKKISKTYGFTMAEIFGVATFYSFFSLKPKGKYIISVCMGTACYVKGAGKVLDRLKEELGINVGGVSEDGRFSLEACRCLGACGLAPVIKVNENVHGKLQPEDIPDILKQYE